MDASTGRDEQRFFLSLDLTSVKLPRILCARKGLVRFISSTSSLAVDFTVRAGAVLDSSNGRSWSVTVPALDPFILAVSAGSGLRRRTIGSANRVHLFTSTVILLERLLWVGAGSSDLLNFRLFIIDTRDCFIDLEEGASACVVLPLFTVTFAHPFSLPHAKPAIGDRPASLLV